MLRSQLGPGDHLLLGNDAYGGTLRLIARVLAPTGITFTPVDLTDPDAVERAWTPSTRLVWVETPTNPLLTVVDIGAVAEAAHERGGICVVDNTFATPYLQRPLARGADVVVHSSTKYLGGHSDVVGGFVAVSDPYVAEVVGFLQNAVGAVPGPFDCYLQLRGIKTLGVRMDRHCANAAAVADLLVAHPAVASVRYPGLPWHPGHEIATRQMSGFGGMVSFVATGGAEAARAMAERTRVFTLAESLGRGREPDRGPGGHDPPVHRGHRARGRSGPGAPLGRDRDPRRPARRPRAGAHRLTAVRRSWWARTAAGKSLGSSCELTGSSHEAGRTVTRRSLGWARHRPLTGGPSHRTPDPTARCAPPVLPADPPPPGAHASGRRWWCSSWCSRPSRSVRRCGPRAT